MFSTDTEMELAAEAISQAIGIATAPLLARIAALERRRGSVGLDDVAFVDTGEKCLLRLTRNGRVQDIVVPIPIDRGVHKPGTKYFRGAMVTSQGSLWCAQADTAERPGDGATSWRLTSKRGKDGRDGRDAV